MMEGTDWPVCAAVYCVGMPGSLNTVVQLLGRAMRLKGEDYPEPHRDRAQLVFFVPCGGGSALADLSIDHSRHALLTCCFLADHEVGQEWIVLRQVHRGIEDALGPREQNPAAADAENEAGEPLAPEVRGEVELALANAREQIISEGREPTLGEVVRQAMQARSDLPEGAFRQVATEIVAAQPEEGARVEEAIRKEIARRLQIHPAVKEAMEEAFAAVLDEFRDVTLKDSAGLECVGRQIHGVTGGHMREFAQRLRDAVPSPLTEDQILMWADTHYGKAGTWPRVDSGAIPDVPEETWRDGDRALRRGLRSLPGSSSLPQLLTEKRDARNRAELEPLTEKKILEWADIHRDRFGEWPGKDSGPIIAAPGETWSGVNAALQMRIRGIKATSSLAQLLAEKRGVRNQKRLSRLTTGQIMQWADAHYARIGEWPKKDSGSIVDAPGETWGRIDGNLREGSRGLPAGSSLALLLAEKRGVRNHLALPPLTEEEILQWADAFHAKNGQWPRVKSGAIDEAHGDTWTAVDQALRNGLRNLPGSSSLAQLLAERRGVRNQKQLSQLTLDQILQWADAYHDKMGRWPRHNAGSVDGTAGETWIGVDGALRNGSRGLPRDSSLAKLLAEHRDVRNVADLAPLVEEDILKWAEMHYARTGQRPCCTSGAIEEVPGETWEKIDRALRRGFRTLTGGSSLAQLIKEYHRVRKAE